MPFVLDASIAASWGLADESSALADKAKVQLESEPAIVPHIWWYEIRNILLVSERRQRLTVSDSVAFLHDLSSLAILIDTNNEDSLVFQVARTYRLSFYDAAYLALAIRESLPLATLDKALTSAAQAAGVALLA